MRIDDERVEVVVRSLRQFFNELVKHDVNIKEWEEFLSNKTMWNKRLGLDNVDLDIDENGSRWKQCEEATSQGIEWDDFINGLKNGLENIVFEWIVNHDEDGWNDLMRFLNNRKEDFLKDVMVYRQLHPSGTEDDGGVIVELDEITEEFEKYPISLDDEDEDDPLTENPSHIEGDEDDSTTIDDIISRIRQEVEDEQSEVSLKGENNDYTD
jgi:hypothetical protein